jgi:hypothetical protein
MSNDRKILRLNLNIGYVVMVKIILLHIPHVVTVLLGQTKDVFKCLGRVLLFRSIRIILKTIEKISGI